MQCWGPVEEETPFLDDRRVIRVPDSEGTRCRCSRLREERGCRAQGKLCAFPTTSRDGCSSTFPCVHLKIANTSRPPLTWSVVSMTWKGKDREKVRRLSPPPKLAHNLLEPSTSRAQTAAVAILGPLDPLLSRPCPPPSANPLHGLCLLPPR